MRERMVRRRLLRFLLALAVLPGAGAAATGTAEAVRYMIVVTGGELLSGGYADGHTHFLTRTLYPLGLHCVGSMCVDDKRDDLKEALRFAVGKAPLVIVTGGLGPTDNDVTREAISEFTGIALAEHPELVQRMARRFGVAPEQLRANLRRQVRTPVGGSYLDNAGGTAVGLVFEADKGAIVALPGPPGELQPMVRDELIPYLSRRFGTRLPGRSLTLRFVGLGQSEIDQRIKEHVTLDPDITTGSQFQGGRVDFTFSLPDDTSREKERLDALKRKIVAHLGEYIYAADETSLEQHVVNLLRARGATLSLAEVGSGGTVAAALNGAEGAGDAVLGAHVAPTMERLHHLLDVHDANWARSASGRDAVERLAAAAARAATSQWAVAVGPLQEDGFVEVAFRRPTGAIESERVALRGVGELARSRFVTHLLDRLRRKMQQSAESK
ncbi:MAG: molybdopterin-binding protein [Sedimentisphaerales bacterium]|nr:molybdopterin-binding protein [Sedimentisphaerales bacterium]HNY79003.1 molybdopterin-binding protein [Sedimentisphaerales bacterium]HOC64048.1 molybdopterin-binding protein [Sedimentisphaerales bacterium]HOH64917.1 molybdopterin-binding protein [Sedimentisphaerales bacterium]HPY51532.1 molybdopterin-binding protein [Sedimentisphaerales bacterium]